MSQDIKYKLPKEIEAFTNLDSSFIEFEHFEVDPEERQHAISRFIEGLDYTPTFDYPRLNKLYDVDEDSLEDDKRTFSEKKSEAWNAVLELEANKESGVKNEDEFQLIAGFHEYRLKRMMLVEAARDMMYADNSASQVTARKEFMSLNRELFGEINEDAFSRIMNSENARILEFIPIDENAKSIKEYLTRYFSDKSFEKKESEILSIETLTDLGRIIRNKYASLLEPLPITDDSIVYNAEECKNFLQASLDRFGLGKKGWIAQINPRRLVPVTSQDSKEISIPSDTSRTANQLTRLDIHEAGVHALRGQNGEETGFNVLKEGTANYSDAEEGLAVLFECAIEGDFNNDSFTRARDRYITAGLAFGTDGIPKDARKTFEILWRIIAIRESSGKIGEDLESYAKNRAVSHIENAFRGTNYAMPGIIYTKLKVYYEGLLKNGKFIEKNKADIGRALEMIMLGKYDHTDTDELNRVKRLLKIK